MDRRIFLSHAGLGAAALFSDRVFSFRTFAGPPGNDYGVASGDPAKDSVTLWTRLPDDIARLSEEHEVDVVVSTDPLMTSASIVAHKTLKVSAATDFCCKIRVQDLPSNAWLYYWFSSNSGYTSQIGRTRTLPKSNEAGRLRFAVVSCQDYSVGHYNVYEKIAIADVDFVVHLGDHIYETEEKAYDKNYVRHDPVGEAHTLSDYRAKYKLYLTDSRLRHVRSQVPFVSIWDDHEVFNDYAGLTMTAIERARQQSGYQAFLEYNPVAIEPDNQQPRMYRSFEFGNLAKFIVLDQRQYRTKQPCKRTVMASGCARQHSTQQTMLGATQRDWFCDELTRRESPITFVLSEVMFSQYRVPVGLGSMLGLESRKEFEATSQYYMSLDAWDGYVAERQKIIDAIEKENISNITILTGDIHNYYTCRLHSDPFRGQGKLIAREFVTASITSNGIGDYIGSNLSTLARSMIMSSNSHFDFADTDHHGCLIVDVTASKYSVSALAVSTIKSAKSKSKVLYKNDFSIIEL